METSVKQEPLCIGDFVCLYSEEKRGYVMSYQTSSAHNEIAVGSNQHKEFPVIPNVQAVVFQICVPYRYKLSKKLPKAKAIVDENPSDVVLQTQYAQAKNAAASETRDNNFEQQRQNGKTVLYGQTLQLKHIFTGKWIHVNPIQTSLTEKSNMMVELKEQSSKSAFFRILPRYKVKTEGDVILVQDQVIFESVKSPGQYIHISRHIFGSKMVYSDCYEMNLSANSSGFTVCLFHKPEKDKQHTDKIHGGSMVQFYHREVEAYMVAEGIDENCGEDVHLRVRRADQTKPKSLYPPTSSITYWQFEKERSLIDGNEIGWDDYVRIRNVLSRLYLMVNPDGKLTMTNDCQLLGTLFRLHPVVKRSEYVASDSAVRLENAATGMWIHGFEDKPYKPRKVRAIEVEKAKHDQFDQKKKKKQKSVDKEEGLETMSWSAAERKMVGAVKEMKYDDAFTLNIVEDKYVWETNFVAGMVPLLHKFAWDLSNDTIFKPRLLSTIATSLSELQDFMIVDSMPSKTRQKGVRNFMIVDIAVELLKFRAKKPDIGHMEPLFASLISLLSVYLQGNSRKNELYMGRHMDFFLNQIGDTTGPIGLTATMMTIELLQNNRTLVEKITTSHIDLICHLVKQHLNYRYLDLLSALCVCDKIALGRNQNYIADQLLLNGTTGTNRGNVFLLTALGETVGKRKNVVYISWDNGKTWQTLHDFTSQTYGTDYYFFLRNQLHLFTRLCSGRNSYAADLISEKIKMVTWEECYICMTDRKLAHEIRAIYCKLLYDLFINVGSNIVNQDKKLVFVYDEIQLPEERKKNTNVNPNTYKPIPLPFMEPLKLWINSFLSENDAMIASEVGRNTLISEVLSLIRQLALLGYYEDFKEVKAVLEPILGLLEGSDDLPYQVDNIEMISRDVKELVEAYQTSGRFKKSTCNSAMVTGKVCACNAGELLFNIRSTVRLDRFISWFKQIYAQEMSGSHHELFRMLYDTYDFEEYFETSTTAVQMLEDMFQETNYVGDEFVPVAMDLCKYEYEEVVAEAMFLLHRYFSSFQDLLESALETQILVTEKSKETKEMITTNMRLIRLMLADKNIDAENADQMKNLLQDFTSICYIDGDQMNESQPHPINQQMLYNHGVMGDIFDIITGEIETEHEIFKEILAICFKLLKGLARGNKVVQTRLFERMGTFLKTSEVAGDDLAAVFVEIFAGNKELCLKIPSKIIVTMVNMLATTRSPTMIRLLSSLVMIEDTPLKRNQGLVIKALFQYKDSIEIVTESTPEYRMKLLTSEESKKGVLDKKRYFCNVVQLLALCSQGDNKAVESICQTMFKLQEILDMINLPQLCNGLRGPFVQFLVAVFFTSDLDVVEFEMKEISNDPKIWRYIDSLSDELKSLSEIVQNNPSMVTSLLKWRPTKLHKSKDDKEHEIKETLHYTFEAVLPFLQIFFKKYYQKEYIEDESYDNGSMITTDETSIDFAAQAEAEKKIATRLLNQGLFPFANHVQECLASEHQLKTLRDAVYDISDAVGVNEELPDIAMALPQRGNDLMARYREYYEEEQHLNIMFVWFVQNLKDAYGGLNTVKHQLGYPLDKPYTNLESDEALPLGKEFQELVSAFVRADTEESAEKYLNVSHVIKQIGNALHYQPTIERDKIRQVELTTKNLQVLRAVIHNEIVKIPDEASAQKKMVEEQEANVEELQNILIDMNILESVLDHISSSSEKVAKEVLALLAAVLNGGNEKVQTRFMTIWTSSREEPFFASIKARMVLSEERLYEKRLITGKREKIKLTEMAKQADKWSSLEDSADEIGGQKDKTWMQSFLSWFGISSKEPQAEKIKRKELKLRPLNRRDCHGATCVPKPPEVELMIMSQDFRSSAVRSTLMETFSINTMKQVSIKALHQAIITDAEDQSMTFQDTGHLGLVLKVLAGLCDGQNTKLQDYLRDQYDNLKKLDIVGETANFLGLMYASLDKQSVETVTHLLDGLIEMVQGNEANQVVVFDRKAIDYLNHMIRMESFPGCSEEQIWSLKRSIGILITDMTEVNSASGHTKMIMEAVGKDDVAQVMCDAFGLLNGTKMNPDLGELVMTVGFCFHHILCRAIDIDPRIDVSKYQGLEAWKYFMGHTLSIEIQQGDTLQRVYFTVEDKEVMRDSVKERLKWEVDRSSPSNKLRDFMDWAKEVCRDITYQRKIQAIPFYKLLVNNWTLLNHSVLLLTFILNLVVLFGWVAPEQYDSDYDYSVDSGNFAAIQSNAVTAMIIILGSVHATLCAMLLASFLLANRPTLPTWMTSGYRLLKRLVKKKKKHEKELTGLDELKTDYLAVNLLSFGSMYFALLLLLSVLGVLFNAAFFAFHMLHIANQNQLLRRVIMAVTLNGRSMLWVCFLGLIFFYIFALTGFLFLRNIFLGNQLYCHTMFECYVSTIRNGLMTGMTGSFEVASDDPNSSFTYYSFKSLYDIGFFALISTIGLNIIFGIIIDTFSQLREGKVEIEEDMNSNCFICNRETFEFEHHGKGFDQHVKEEHSMWAYLFFFIHLKDTPTNDLTSLELYVYNMINEDSIDFFPLGKALTLSQWEEENEDTKLQKLNENIDYLMSRLREQDAEKEHLQQAESRAAKQQARKDQQEQHKSFWGKAKKKVDDATAPKLLHGTYGPCQYKFKN